jgi:flagellar protein FlgJ
METNASKTQFDMARNVHDMSSINSLREAVNSGDESALQEAAQQFEAIFVQMMLKSMRKAQDALADEDSPFNSDQVKFYREMHDQQLANDLSSGGGLGLASIIVQQLGPNEDGKFTPASVLRNDANLASLNQHGRLATQKAQAMALESESVAVNGAYKDAAFASPQAFVEQLYPHAQKIAERLGIDPKAIIAQAAVETGWGQYVIHDGAGKSSNNLFGVKANQHWQGGSATVDTLEFDGAVAKPQKASFRTYDSIADSMQDYVNFVQSQGRYSQAVEKAGDTQQYFQALQEAGYATDPNYANKVMSVVNGDTLRGYLP